MRAHAVILPYISIPFLPSSCPQYGIPSWLVALRHDGTHRMLPSLAPLHSGATFAISWLRENYWEPQAELMREGGGEGGGGGKAVEGGKRAKWGVRMINQDSSNHSQPTSEVSCHLTLTFTNVIFTRHCALSSFTDHKKQPKEAEFLY